MQIVADRLSSLIKDVDLSFWNGDAGLKLRLEDFAKTLAEKIHQHTKESEEELFKAFEYAADHGNLKLHETDNDIQWQWTDYL